LFTLNERHFLAVLEQDAGICRVFGKVRVAGGPRGSPERCAAGRFNRIGQKHLDFVICDPHSLSVACAVELDHRTHGRADRRARDALLEGALAAARVPLLRVPSRSRYDVAEVRALLDAQTLQKATQGR